MTGWIEELKALGTCGDAVEWCETQATPNDAWNNCQNPRWMLWYVARVSGKAGSTARRTLVGVLVEIVRPVLSCMPKGDSKLSDVLETLERYSRGDATVRDVRIAAAKAPVATYYKVAYHAAAAIAKAVVVAVGTDYYPADAFPATSYHTATDAAPAASYYAARVSSDTDCDRQLAIIRKHYPEPPK